MAHFTQIALGHVADEAIVYPGEILDPSDYAKLDPIIVEAHEDPEFGESYDIVDGRHRSSGMVYWAHSMGRDPEVIRLRVVVVDDADDPDVVLDAQNDDSETQEESIQELLRSAGAVKQSRRVMIENPAALKQARRHRETFMDRPASKQTQMQWAWPKRMDWVGHCDAVMYASDKWKKPGTFEDYKHVAESEQKVFVTRDFIRDYHTRKPLKLEYEEKKLPTDMPAAFAELANVFGIQVKFFSGDHYNVDVARAKLGAATQRNLGTFLFVYTVSGGVHMIITGKNLRVERDGITG